MGKMDEQIIVIKRSDLFGQVEDNLLFQGTEREEDSVAELKQRMAKYFTVMRRGDAEENPAYKQPIPYAVLKKGIHYFTYRRLGGGGEERLYGKLSVGVGGHMNKVKDAENFQQVLAENLDREINEELILSNADAAKIQTIGIINDDETEVGKVHVGVLIVVVLPENAEVAVREKDKLEGSWKTLQELTDPAILERMESWSGLAINVLRRR
jgi:predicted NUDIX family phosphoesterase